MENRNSLWTGGSVAFLLGWLAGRSRARRYSFHGRTVFITGGSRGLGLILARQFAREGARVAICARNAGELERAAREIVDCGGQAYALVCDVSDRNQVGSTLEKVARRFGPIDVLVNNASIIQVGPFESMSFKDFDDAMAVNHRGTVNATLHSLRHLRKGDARIMNITSIGGTVPVPHLLPYTAAKFATVGFSQGIRAELSGKGVKVTTVVPGLMRTGSFVNALFKGKRGAEYSLFSLGATLPGISIDAERAARVMIAACRKGDPFVTVGLPAKLMRAFHAALPGTTARIEGAINRALPSSRPGARVEASEPGWRNETAVTRSPATLLGRRAARRNNQAA